MGMRYDRRVHSVAADGQELEPIPEPSGTGSFCGVCGAKCACPPLGKRFWDRLFATRSGCTWSAEGWSAPRCKTQSNTNASKMTAASSAMAIFTCLRRWSARRKTCRAAGDPTGPVAGPIVGGSGRVSGSAVAGIAEVPVLSADRPSDESPSASDVTAEGESTTPMIIDADAVNASAELC